MRVTGGIARGFRLQPPTAPGVRPTTNRVRGALFSILAPYGIEGMAVADFFAGTGSLGIEALSRGAASADFVEANARQVRVIRANLEATGLAGRAQTHQMRAVQAVERLSGPWHLVLMDPPYADPFPAGVVARLAERRLLAEPAIVVVGHATRTPAPETCGTLTRWQDRRYGDSALAFYRAGGPPAVEAA